LESRMRRKSHVRFGVGERAEITSKPYLSLPEKKVNFETEKRFIKFIKSAFKNGWINNLQSSLKSGVKSVFGIVLLWVGANEVIHGRLSIGELLTFNALLAYFLEPIENLINLQPQIQTALVAADRLGEILDLEIEKSKNEDKKINPASLRGDIDFVNVTFRYGTRQKVLDDITLHICSGEKIALVGESGSGKTTLVKLLMSFYQPEKGDILINGYNIKDINLEVLRCKIAYISQNAFFFNGTIRENLTLGVDSVSFEEIIEACKKSQIHDFINSLPLRYETTIEENGANLSGGQKQRLAIARAILKKPDILIMDEATSNLDSTTEKTIHDMIYEFSKDITTIIIAHRLSTIMRSDTIYVMDKGKIVESGSHEELMRLRGKYYELWKDQIPISNYELGDEEAAASNLIGA